MQSKQKPYFAVKVIFCSLNKNHAERAGVARAAVHNCGSKGNSPAKLSTAGALSSSNDGITDIIWYVADGLDGHQDLLVSRALSCREGTGKPGGGSGEGGLHRLHLAGPRHRLGEGAMAPPYAILRQRVALPTYSTQKRWNRGTRITWQRAHANNKDLQA